MKPTLHIELKVKFRALLITWASYSKSWDIPLPAVAETVASDKALVTWSQNGVDLNVTLKP